jgi:hypothetical protein
MFTELLKPVINAIYPVTINEVRHHIQKEKRIIDTLEPVLNAHRLIVDPIVVKNDFKSIVSYPIESQNRYALFYQLSRITREKGSLLQDDRLDALSIAVNYWTEQMAINADLKIKDRKEDLIQEELEKFMNSAFNVSNKGKLQTTWF